MESFSSSPGPERTERLDDRTENAIEEFRGRTSMFESCDCESMPCVHAVKYEAARNALRQRIRELVKEAATMKATPGKLPAPEWDY